MENLEPEKKSEEKATISPLLVLGKGVPDVTVLDVTGKGEPVVPKAMLDLPVRINTAKGWLAPAYMNDVFLLLTADTGAAVTMLNTAVFRRYFPDKELEPSTGEFTTANNEPMPTVGQFRANVQIGPVTIAHLMITVADVIGDGLLGMD